jgi:hypothetical protein
MIGTRPKFEPHTTRVKVGSVTVSANLFSDMTIHCVFRHACDIFRWKIYLSNPTYANSVLVAELNWFLVYVQAINIMQQKY